MGTTHTVAHKLQKTCTQFTELLTLYLNIITSTSTPHPNPPPQKKLKKTTDIPPQSPSLEIEDDSMNKFYLLCQYPNCFLQVVITII